MRFSDNPDHYDKEMKQKLHKYVTKIYNKFKEKGLFFYLDSKLKIITREHTRDEAYEKATQY